MKFFLTSDLRVGMECTESISVEAAHRWAQAVTEKLDTILEKAIRMGADLAIFPGRVFNSIYVPESAVDALLDTIRANRDLPVILCPDSETHLRLSVRKDLPDNLILLCEDDETMTIGKTELSRSEGGITIRVPSENVTAELTDVAGVFFDGAVRLPSFEPSGWEEAENGVFGYAVMDTGQNTHKTFCTKETRFKYRNAEVNVEPDDDAQALRSKSEKAAADCGGDTFLRLTLKGKTAFARAVDTAALREYLQGKVFAAEVFDNTVMVVDERALENDISLQSEFVRLVLQDDSLSEAERGRLITCGWNALCGREGNA